MIEDEAYEVKEVDKDVMYNIIPSVAMHSNTGLNSYASVETWLLTNRCSDVSKIWDALLDEKLHSKGVRGSTSDTVREMADKLKVEDINTLERVDVDQPHYNVMFSGGWDSVSLIIRHLEKGEAVIPFYIIFDEKWVSIAKLTINILRKVYGAKLLDGLHIMFGPLYCRGNEEVNLAQQSFATFYASRIDRRFQRHAIATEIAYCMNDDAISYLDDLRALYDASLRATYPVIQNSAPLSFPQTKFKHRDNSDFVENWMRDRGIALPVTGLDNCEVSFEYTIDKENNYWIAMLAEHDYDDPWHKKENKETGLFATAIIMKLTGMTRDPVTLGPDAKVDSRDDILVSSPLEVECEKLLDKKFKENAPKVDLDEFESFEDRKRRLAEKISNANETIEKYAKRGVATKAVKVPKNKSGEKISYKAVTKVRLKAGTKKNNEKN